MTAEIVDITKNRYNVHAELRLERNGLLTKSRLHLPHSTRVLLSVTSNSRYLGDTCTASPVRPSELIVVLVNSELIGTLRFVGLPSVPFRRLILGALRRSFCLVPEPRRAAAGN